ncbi:MAG: HEAT repeat domain-containing protein [Spirulina sp.]
MNVFGQIKQNWLRVGFLLILAICLSISTCTIAQIKTASPTTSTQNIELYLQQLKYTDRDWQIRSKAAFELGKSKSNSPVVIQALTKVLEDSDPVVRLRATFALVEIGSPAIPHLIATLEDSSTEVQARAGFALGQIGIPALPSLNGKLDAPNSEIMINVVTIIEQIAEDINSQANALPKEEIAPAIAQFEVAIMKVRNLSQSKSPTGFNLESPIAQELEEKTRILQQTVHQLKTELRSRFLRQVVRLLIIFLGIPLLGLIITFWFKLEFRLNGKKAERGRPSLPKSR